MGKKSDTSLITRKIDSLNKEELEAFIKIYQDRILSIMEKVAEILEEIRLVRKEEDSSRRRRRFYILARTLAKYLQLLRIAGRRAEDAELRLDELAYGSGRKSGDTLTEKQKRMLFGIDLSRPEAEVKIDGEVDFEEEEEEEDSGEEE